MTKTHQFAPVKELTPAILGAMVAILWLAAGCASGEPAPIPVDQLALACVSSAACGVEARPGVSLCIDNYRDNTMRQGKGGLYGDIYRCTIKAKGDCTKVHACFGARETCTRKQFTASCEGSTSVSCDLIDGRIYAQRCGDVGLRCRVDPKQTFAANCYCDGSYERRCQGDLALHCSGGQVIGEYCGDEGMSCRDGVCKATTKSQGCEPGSAPYCDGAIAVTCAGDGKQNRIDCGARATRNRCDKGRCVSSGSDCGDDFNRCTADGALEACIDGRWRRFDCIAMGLRTCKTARFGANCGALRP